MRILFALVTTLLFSLVSTAFCQDEDGPDIFPDEHTRKLARELDLKSVKSVYISSLSGEITVTDPKVIASIVEGLKTAYTTNFTNKVDYVGVMDKNDDSLIDYSFSVSHFPELSPKLAEGLKDAGIELKGWQEWQERRQRSEALDKKMRELLTWALPLAMLSGLAFFVFRRHAKPQI